MPDSMLIASRHRAHAGGKPAMNSRQSSENMALRQPKYDRPGRIARLANERFFSAIRQAVHLIQPESVLEAGCGEGVNLAIIQEVGPKCLVGVDLDRRRLQLAAALESPALLSLGDIHRLPFGDQSFEMVMLLEVLEHVGHPELALKEAIRVSGRYLLLSVPNEPWWRLGNLARLKFVCQFGNTPEHINHWSAFGFRRFIANHLEILRATNPFLWTFILAEKRS
jgi:ubiquinone/menaquinone biosynthesis C-methylase UbiE